MLYLGIDIGSVSIKYALIDDKCNIKKSDYFRTKGDVVGSITKLLKSVKKYEVVGIGTTGSARKFVCAIINADINVDEITAHRTGVEKLFPKVHTIFEIGGQDSKLIYLGKKSVNFEMNHVCAAGTGSFLDQQASRLDMSIKKFCKNGAKVQDSHKIASKCTVFAESDMIHAQQSGVPINKVIRGVHKGLISNYFSQLCKGKKLIGDFLFEGGTSENPLLVDELGKRLVADGLLKDPKKLIVPPRPQNLILGAIGAALMCQIKNINNPRKVPQIKKFKFLESKECFECVNKCGAKITVVNINNQELTIGRSCQNE